MKIGMIGSRSFANKQLAKLIIDILIKKYSNITLVSGGCKEGADKICEDIFDEYGLPKIIHYADWKKYGKSAGFKRNPLIINDSNIVIAFWDGKSKGTKNSIDIALSLNKPIKIINI